MEDGVGERRFADVIMPGVDRELAGDQGGLAAVAIVEDLEQIAARVVVECDQSEIVKHNEIGLGVVAQEFRVPAVGLGNREVLEEPGQPQIASGMAIATRLVGERTGEPGLADAPAGPVMRILSLLRRYSPVPSCRMRRLSRPRRCR